MQHQDLRENRRHVLGKNHVVVVVCLVENLHTGTRFIIANAHIHWVPVYRDVKLVQVALLLEELEKTANGFAKYPPPKSAMDGELLTPSELSTPPQSAHTDESEGPGLETVNSAVDGNESTTDADSQPPPNSAQSSQPYRSPPTYTDGTKIPLIICGDFNSVPGSGVYEFLKSLAHETLDWLYVSHTLCCITGTCHHFAIVATNGSSFTTHLIQLEVRTL